MVGAVIDIMHTTPLPFANALSMALSSLPAADRASLSELSISDMRAWTVAKADEYHRYTLALHSVQNTLAPVHRLPPEILSRIFVEAWEDRKSLRLTHVCRIWRSLLLDTSRFWAVAIAGDNFKKVSDEDYLNAACFRSSPRNISLHLSSISLRGHLTLMQHAARITSMQISAHTRVQLELLWKVLHAGMPRLENLSVRVCDSVTGSVGLSMLSTEQLPLLTRLTLPARLFYSWPNTLQQIAFRSDGSELQMVSLETVLRSLEDYPRLRTLDIGDNTLSHDSQSQPPLRAFLGPTLEFLRIRSHLDTVRAILSLLTFPSSTRVDIGIVFGRPHSLRDLFVPGSALDTVVALIDSVTIHGGRTSTIRGLTDGAERLRFTARLSFWDPSVIAIRLFRRTNAPVSRLLLAQHPAQRMPATSTGSTIFSAFSRLTHLTLHGRSSVCSGFLSALHPTRTASSEPALLPLLKDLTVGIATKRCSGISKSLRGGPNAPASVVTTHFRECCRIFPEVLDGRRQQGLRLSRLEFFSYEEGCMARPGKPDPVVSHVDLAALCRNVVEREIEPLRRFVDDSVVFSGYRFLTYP